MGGRRRARGPGRAGSGLRHRGGIDYRRTFSLVSADVLDLLLGAWLPTRAVMLGGRLVIAVDEKTVPGARSKGGKAPNLVVALAHGTGAASPGTVLVAADDGYADSVAGLVQRGAEKPGHDGLGAGRWRLRRLSVCGRVSCQPTARMLGRVKARAPGFATRTG